MDDISKLLKQNGFTQSEITKFNTYYQYAIDNKIPYPYYYALSKMTV